jgi:choline dehydrogenase
MADYIIIGAGSAGCVLANRLTENSDASTLLLEAGGPDDNPDIRIPARWDSLLGTEIDWAYQTEPQVQLNNRVVDWGRGKVLGGSSSINAMVYIRGHRWDYDRWAELGNEEWGYAQVLPYFIKSENQERGASEYHGVGGPLNVAGYPTVSPLAEIAERFIKAGLELGLPLNDDFNGATQEGIGRYQFTHKDGERHSTADAWLKPALKRDNLTIETYAHVTRIIFEGIRAVGVEYAHENQIKRAFAEREVILCGGAINSPQVLLCSGIGPADHLQQFDIPVIVDLPGVGRNLQDHPIVGLRYATITPMKITSLLLQAADQEYQRFRTGLLAVNRVAGGAFVKTRPDLDIPDMQLYAGPCDENIPGDLYTGLCLLRPKDRGSISLRSSNPFDYPVIQPNYLGRKEGRQSFIDGVKFVRQLAQTKAYEGFVDSEVVPGADVQTDAEITAWLCDSLGTTWHYSGTCKMGVDPLAVVNPQLQVYGVKSLRVVDASIMPKVVGGNTNAPVIMIAEKAADLIKAGA